MLSHSCPIRAEATSKRHVVCHLTTLRQSLAAATRKYPHPEDGFVTDGAQVGKLDYHGMSYLPTLYRAVVVSVRHLSNTLSVYSATQAPVSWFSDECRLPVPPAWLPEYRVAAVVADCLPRQLQEGLTRPVADN